MPAQKKKSSGKKNTSSQKSRGRRPSQAAVKEQLRLQYEEQQRNRRRIASVILFASAILLFMLSIIKGASVWNVMHNAVWGLFGVCSFLFPVTLAYSAVVLEKYGRENPGKKITQTVILSFLIGGFLHLVGDPLIYTNIGEFFKSAVNAPAGIFGTVLGEPLWVICGKKAAMGRVCAMCVLVVLMFIFIMLVTESSILNLFSLFKRSVDSISSHRRGRYDDESDDYDEYDDYYGDEDYEEEPEPLPPPKKKSKSSGEGSLRKLKGSVINNYDGEEPTEDKADFEMITEMPYHSVDQEERSNKSTAQPEKAGAESNEDPNEDREKQKFKRFLEILNSDGSTYSEDENKRDEKPAEKSEKTDKKPEEEIKIPLIEIEEDGYNFPPVSLLTEPSKKKTNANAELQRVGQKLIHTLESFNVKAEITDISRGPSVTRFELKPAPGIRVNKFTTLADDIALSLASPGIRIEAPIPGKSAVGIEVPNKKADIVNIREVIDSKEFSFARSSLSVALGKDIAGKIVVADVAKMPHVLIAGTTGSGKSVCINSIIISLLYKSSPNDVKLLMVDPKVVELGVYNGIPHLLVPVVTDPKKAAGALGWAVTEMLRRYKLFSEIGVRDLTGYNKRAENDETMRKLPQVVIIIDELADLMMVAPGEVEDYIMRLAQMARAAGMHLIIATQRPTVDVITGTIKSNIPSRIAFAVSDGIHSRTILDANGAEKLIGRGDMLFNPVGSMKPSRIQGCFVSDDEIEAVVEYVKSNGDEAEYDDDVMQEIENLAAQEGSSSGGGVSNGEPVDEMLAKAIECVIDAGQASTSYLQRKLGLGYARAARLMDEMESRGIIGEYNGSKPREVLITKQQYFEMQNAGTAGE